MRKEDLRIVYMGTPEFAVEPLRCLVEGGYNIAGVITMPDKPAGRGHKVQFSPVKQYALEHGLPLLQPEKLKDEPLFEAFACLECGFADCGRFQDVAGGGMEHAAIGHLQPACFPASAVSRRSPHQLGGD